MSNTNKFRSLMNELLQLKADEIRFNPAQSELMIALSFQKNVEITNTNRILVVNPEDSRGRSPKDTYIVKNSETVETVDWDSFNAMDPTLFEDLLMEAFEVLKKKKAIYSSNYVIGANEKSAIPIKLITDNPLSVLFAQNMFRKFQSTEKSLFHERDLTIIVLPHDKINHVQYESDMVIGMDFQNGIILIQGNAYNGSIKKSAFTFADYIYPLKGILPLHCSANEGPEGTALMLGLSGTGKTTLSADDSRYFIGDDEHGWGENGIFNLEGGCYAKTVGLDPKKEPVIYDIIVETKTKDIQPVIIENVKINEDKSLNFDNTDLTENGRVSYPLEMLPQFKSDSAGGHPKNIIFLTMDASGILPPVSRLTPAQAKFWFLMGYTSKVAGTERGVREPQPTFSKFFGAPFMPLKPQYYLDLFEQKITEHATNIWLVNTGLNGTGKRIDIAVSRAILKAIFDGKLENTEFNTDPIFYFDVPKSCMGVDSEILNPENTWESQNSFFDARADLVNAIARHFRKNFSEVGKDIQDSCPCQMESLVVD